MQMNKLFNSLAIKALKNLPFLEILPIYVIDTKIKLIVIMRIIRYEIALYCNLIVN